jgi:hypothetical protein
MQAVRFAAPGPGRLTGGQLRALVARQHSALPICHRFAYRGKNTDRDGRGWIEPKAKAESFSDACATLLQSRAQARSGSTGSPI